MLKRAGTIASGVTAGLLAVAPMAVAGEDDNSVQQFEQNNEQEAVSVDDNNVQVPVQACNNNVPINVLGVQVPIQDVAAVLGFENEDSSAANNDSCEQDAGQSSGDGGAIGNAGGAQSVN